MASTYSIAPEDYKDALKLAGANVLAFERFGSYQGDWWAHVILPDGTDGWIHDYYGSCSGCDAFEAEFGYFSSDWMTEDALRQAIADFGRKYFEQIMTKEAALAEANQHSSWDAEADEMVKWIETH